MRMSTTKAFSITKQEVYEAYLQVRANRGSAGVDEVTIEKYEENLKDNLYKLWNRMSSGSYFPKPVKGVDIPKGKNKTRPLGIPTVNDRIAQAVVKNRLEPRLEEYFHDNSYGYRPNKTAGEAVKVAKERCKNNDWVVDLDIKGYFNNIDHELLMKAVAKHVQEKWIKLYIKRWLETPVEKHGERIENTKGTPQGAVISPLLANLFLHYTFDIWMRRKCPTIPFERFADDIVCHCKTQRQAKWLMNILNKRFNNCGLTLHPIKSKIVYCKDGRRTGDYENTEFDFLGFTFKRRTARSQRGQIFISFTPAVSKKASRKFLEEIKKKAVFKIAHVDLQIIAKIVNPMIRGWVNYFEQFRRSEMNRMFRVINNMIVRWLRRKYKKLTYTKEKTYKLYRDIAKSRPTIFYHWNYYVYT